MIFSNSFLSFGLADEPADRERIYRLRVENYETDSPYLLQGSNGGLSGQDHFDDNSFLFYAKSGGSLIATCRLTPHGSHGWELSGRIPDSLLPGDSDRFAQFNRTLVDRRFRNRNIHAPMFYFVSEWAMKNTNLRYYFSVCTVPLYRFYAAYGVVKKTDSPITIAGREPRGYYLIEGNFSLTNTLLKQQLIKKNSLPGLRAEADSSEIKDHGEDAIACRGTIEGTG